MTAKSDDVDMSTEVSDSIMEMLVPSGWSRKSIESLCLKVTSGGTPSRSKPEFYTNGTVSWFKTKELKDWYLDESEEKITEEAMRKSSAKLFPPKTVLIAMYGDGRTIGSLGILRKEAATNQACCAMIANEKICDPHFLLYALRLYRRKLIGLALGGAQRNLNGKTIREFELVAPPLETQQRISSILGAYDDLIENNQRRIRILEEMAQRLYREWFVHFRFPGHHNTPLIDSPLGPIPEGWEVKKLGEVYKTASGGTPSRKKEQYYRGEISWLKTKELNDSFVHQTEECITQLGLKNSSARLFPKDTVIIAMYGATIGKLAILALDASTNQACCALLPKHMEYGYAFAFLTLLERRADLISLGQGAAQQNISQIVIREFPVVVPPPELSLRFSNHVEPMLRSISVRQKQIGYLRSARDLLLPKLISGEVRTPNC